MDPGPQDQRDRQVIALTGEDRFDLFEPPQPFAVGDTANLI